MDVSICDATTVDVREIVPRDSHLPFSRRLLRCPSMTRWTWSNGHDRRPLH